jgi:drug/metabolite transporter (DMT)-like permease
MDFAGEFAALFAALAFSVTSTTFTLSGRDFSPIIVMRASLPIGAVCLFTLHWLLTGWILPTYVEPIRWFWLGISGIVGFWLGSISIINAFNRIGPRLTLLIIAIAPILSTFLAYIFLDESLESGATGGILMIIGGIIFVVTGKRGDTGTLPNDGSFGMGVVFALIGALGQSSSFILSSLGLADVISTQAHHTLVAFPHIASDLRDYFAAPGDFHPLSAAVMRISIATTAIWALALLRGKLPPTLHTVRTHTRSLRFLLVGSIAGPVIGASLVLASLQLIPVGVSSTLTNLTPIFLIPISAVVFKEEITLRAMIGTVIAVIGIAILFL